MEIIPCEQRSAEWHAARAGKPTASQFHRIITPKKRTLSDQHVGYMYELIAEKVYGTAIEEDLSYIPAVQYGIDHEPHAVDSFEDKYKLETHRVGFILADGGRYGCSPDRLITRGNGHDGAEIKCPEAHTLVGYWLHGFEAKGAEKYIPQIQGQMLICGFDKVHFYAYRHDMPAWHCEVGRDESYIAQLRQLLDQFCDILEHEYQRALALGLHAVTGGQPRGNHAA